MLKKERKRKNQRKRKKNPQRKKKVTPHMSDLYDVIIIGGGVAGFSSAMYTGRMKLKTLVIVETRGGTIILTNNITNWPGIKKTDGMSLAGQIEAHAKEYEPVIVDAKAVKAEKTENGFRISTGDNKSYEGKSLIIATGSTPRKLGIPGEKELEGKGVHTCALCDGIFYRDKEIAVIGGSDSAAKEALLLTQWAKKVFIIYRKEQIRAEPINLDKVLTNEKIEIINNTNATEFVGETKFEKVILDKEYKGSAELTLDGVFVEIGAIPNSELGKELGVELNKKGEIIIDRKARTNVEGVFAAGDIADTYFKQAIVGAGEAVLAAFGAYEYLQKKA
jgi:thioredoxin-disulfide reductase